MSVDALRPAFAVPDTCRLCAAGLRGQLRRAAFGASAPASDAPECKGSKVVSGGPRNPHAGLPGRSGNLALRDCPARRSPLGCTPEHPPLPSVAGDSGLTASAMPPAGSLSVVRPVRYAVATC